MHFGKRIARLAKSKDWSQLDLASESRVSQQVIYKWVRGDVNSPDAESLVKVADALGTSSKFLLTGMR